MSKLSKQAIATEVLTQALAQETGQRVYLAIELEIEERADELRQADAEEIEHLAKMSYLFRREGKNV